jgi:hypothetical protein
MIIDKNLWFDFCFATENLFTYECFKNDQLRVVVNVYELKDVQFSATMNFGELLMFDEIDIYYNDEIVEWEAV